MKHRIAGKKLGRDIHQRKALFRNLIQALITHEEIKTTETKAKSTRRLLEKLITKAKMGSLSVRRQILSFIPNRTVVNKLIDEIAPRFKDRISGYIRLVKLGKRTGDNTQMVKMELTEKKKVNEAGKIGNTAKVTESKSIIKNKQH